MVRSLLLRHCVPAVEECRQAVIRPNPTVRRTRRAGPPDRASHRSGQSSGGHPDPVSGMEPTGSGKESRCPVSTTNTPRKASHPVPNPSRRVTTRPHNGSTPPGPPQLNSHPNRSISNGDHRRTPLSATKPPNSHHRGGSSTPVVGKRRRHHTTPAPLFAVKQNRVNFVIILAMLVFLWMPYLITRLLRTGAGTRRSAAPGRQR